MTVAELVAERARRFGPLPFDEVVELALYDPEHGFYSSGGGAGRGRGDFLTSPEVGPLFGAVLARALDAWWHDLGRPDPYVVVEAGAGAGALARAVLDAPPACAPALRYVLVERSEALRARQGQGLPLEPARLVLGPSLGPDPDLGARPEPGRGPMVTSLSELPAGPLTGVVMANELLDNLPFGLLERMADGWADVRVGEDLHELLVPLDHEPDSDFDADVGARRPVQAASADWLWQSLRLLERGRVVVVDYADVTESMTHRLWTEWVRTYRSHGRGGHPLEHLGEQDITCEVAVDQLARVRRPDLDRTQADFLRAHGLDDLVRHAREGWEARAHVGDLEALRHRSRLAEAAALTDPAGLGSFRVLEWAAG